LGTLWNRSGAPEWDRNAVIAIGATASFFEAGTSTPKPVYQDGDESTVFEEDVETDGYGRWPAVFIPYGPYKVVIQTSGGTTLFTADDIQNPAPFTDDFELDQDSVLNTGDIFFSFKNGTRTGAVRCNGRTIGNAASSATERANADCEDLFAFLWNNVANGQAAVSGGRGASAAADFAANKTITLPNGQGAAPVGYDDMGNTAGSFLDSAPVVSGGPTTAASVLGANTHTLQTTEIAAHTHGVGSFAADSNGAHTHTGTTDSGGAHTHTVDIASGQGSHQHTNNIATPSGTDARDGGGTPALWFGTTGFASVSAATLPAMTGTATSNGAHTHTFTTASNGAHTHTISGTSASTGGGSAHNNLGRSLLVTWLMRL
jgi:hypothetical protein